jgi:hypothetical protein
MVVAIYLIPAVDTQIHVCVCVCVFPYVQKSAKPKRKMEVVAGTGRRVGLERSAEEVGQTKRKKESRVLNFQFM